MNKHNSEYERGFDDGFILRKEKSQKQIPMTDMDIYTALASITENPEPASEIINDKDWHEIVDIVRRIETHHGITK